MQKAGRGRRRALITIGLLIVAIAELRLFVFPPTDSPAAADAVVMFNGPGERTSYVWELAHDDGMAPTVVISVPDTELCTHQRPEIEEYCFTPKPPTTRGEARAFAKLAAERGWERILVVSSTTQTMRARLRLERCYDGDAQFLAVRESVPTHVLRAVYENGAMLKALLFERGC